MSDAERWTVKGLPGCPAHADYYANCPYCWVNINRLHLEERACAAIKEIVEADEAQG